MTPDDLRELLVAARKRRGQSQGLIAKRMKISQQVFNRMERPHERVDMLLSTFLKWSEAVGVEVILIDRSHHDQK